MAATRADLQRRVVLNLPPATLTTPSGAPSIFRMTGLSNCLSSTIKLLSFKVTSRLAASIRRLPSAGTAGALILPHRTQGVEFALTLTAHFEAHLFSSMAATLDATTTVIRRLDSTLDRKSTRLNSSH